MLKRTLKKAIDCVVGIQAILESDGQTVAWLMGYTSTPEGTWQDTSDEPACPWDHQYLTMEDQGTHYSGTVSIPADKCFYVVYGFTVPFDYGG